MKTAILKLKPNSQFHFGKVGLDENMSLNATSEFMHSDTLFSAMINIISSVVEDKKEIDNFIEEIENNNIQFSSVFYMLSVENTTQNKQKNIFFLPKPVNASTTIQEDAKDIKKIKFVSAKILEEGIKPESWTNEQTCVIIDKKFVCKKDELCDFEEHAQLKIYSVGTTPKVRVRSDKITENLYNQANLMIADNSFIIPKEKEEEKNDKFQFTINFYFLYKFFEASKKNQTLFKLFLNLIPEIGIGGQRSTGCGFVDNIKNVPELKYSISNTSQFLSLSLFIPKNEAEFKEMSAYSFITRGGRNTGSDDLKQKRVRMLTEGSISKSELNGKVKNISPKNSEKTYKRNGKGFFIELNDEF